MQLTLPKQGCQPLDVDALSQRLALYLPRLRLPRYNRAVNVFTAAHDRDAGKLVKRLFPDFDAIDHSQFAQQHQLASEALQKAYDLEVDAVFMRNLCRRPTFGDYKVSAVWRDEFPEDDKALLRGLAHRSGEHRDVARAHQAAAGNLRRRRSVRMVTRAGAPR